MTRHEDTIVALATPTGTAALAVLRISGARAAEIGAALAGGRALAARSVRHLDYWTTAGKMLDDVVVTYFAGPKSYTGEDSLEISCHGNPMIAQYILEDIVARGCRVAEPGEFTQRAFLKGKLDLSQAEAVMDVIHARSERALASAHRQLRGGLGRRVQALVESLLATLARVEAYIDFPDEDLPKEDRATVDSACGEILAEIGKLSATARYGHLLRDGVATVILGAPNAGKSSLLNALVGRERALVSPEPGTTRDFIEERLLVGPHWLRLIDTAGLNPSPAPLERLGMAKTRERVEEADVVLLVVDGASPPALLVPPDYAACLPWPAVIVVRNKADLPAAPGWSAAAAGAPVPLLEIPTSAVTGAGLAQLRDEIVRRIDAIGGGDGEDRVAINVRHAGSLGIASDTLRSAREKLAADGPVELLASDLRAALEALGEITGRVDNERMLDHLFATFCIGK
jgi:tRNA modification GTPase